MKPSITSSTLWEAYPKKWDYCENKKLTLISTDQSITSENNLQTGP